MVMCLNVHFMCCMLNWQYGKYVLDDWWKMNWFKLMFVVGFNKFSCWIKFLKRIEISKTFILKCFDHMCKVFKLFCKTFPIFLLGKPIPRPITTIPKSVDFLCFSYRWNDHSTISNNRWRIKALGKFIHCSRSTCSIGII